MSLVKYVKAPVPNTDSSGKTALPSTEKVFVIPDKLDLCHLENELSGDELRQVKALLSRYSHVFAKHDLDLSHTDVTCHHINLTDITPFKEPHRLLPPAMYEEVRNHIKQMLDLGAIRESHSLFASPVVLVRKSDGSLQGRLFLTQD